MPTVSLTIDQIPVEVDSETTIWEAAKGAGITIPALCHDPKLKPVGVCRLCVVDVGGRVLAASCVRPCEEGMTVTTSSDAIEGHRKMLTELLMSEQPVDCPKEATTGDNQLLDLARTYGVDQSVDSPRRLPQNQSRPSDTSSAVIAVDHQACILCDRCIRACDDVQSNHVIGRTGKGYAAAISFDLNDPMGDSSCVACGECMAACPTGALVNKPLSGRVVARRHLKQVDSVCPYCGVGCALTYHVDEEENRIAYADGRDSPVNDGRLCVKGRYGFDYASHPQRLTRPLIRRESHYPKGPLSPETHEEPRGKRRRRGIVRSEDVLPAFREASWEEALELIATRLLAIRDESGGNALAGFGSAKCSIEEAYVFQKLIRVAFRTNNVDHCTRLCHASSVAALLETIGSGAVTNTFAGIAESDFALFTGTNATANHPVAATFFKEAARRGAKILVVDPRRPDLADHAWKFARIKPGSDVAFYNGMMKAIVDHGWHDTSYIEQRTEGFAEFEAALQDFSPELASQICGIPASEIVEAARAYAQAKAAMTFWGMGISQHTHGTDNARSLISLCLLTGNCGRPGTGLHPLRGQNNVQGASDAGLVPMVYPDYQDVADETVRKKFESAWGVELDPKPGLTVTEITSGALDGSIRGLYCLGENPYLSDPNINKVRKALMNLDFLVVQDIFLTDTAEFADVILPASSYLEKLGTYCNTDRRVQIGRPALNLPGDARLDWQIVCEVANRMGYPMNYDGPEAIFDEFASLTTSYKELSYSALGKTGRLWPAPDKSAADGVQVLFGDGFPTESGRGKFVPCSFAPAKELPDADYPFILNTGRLLEHWHTGTMTRRAKALDAIAPEAFVEVHPDDLERLGQSDGDWLEVSSRRGSIVLRARGHHRVQPGSVFVPFHFREAAANLLTIDEVDPFGKIPEFKFCAVKLAPANQD